MITDNLESIVPQLAVLILLGMVALAWYLPRLLARYLPRLSTFVVGPGFFVAAYALFNWSISTRALHTEGSPAGLVIGLVVWAACLGIMVVGFRFIACGFARIQSNGK